MPESLPMLGRGKHRNMRKGACFMELASLLAGERWTDHPACTHPLLATLARLVNDCTTDAARQRLAVLVPSAIGLTTDDLHADARIALRCAGVALPVVAADRQRAMAVAVLACDRVLAELDGRPTDRLEDYSRSVLAQAPHAARWAESFTRRIAISPDAFRRHAAPSTVTHAVTGIAEACIPDPDQTLYDLLWVAIDDCAVWVRRAAPLDQHPVSDRSRKAYSIRY